MKKLIYAVFAAAAGIQGAYAASAEAYVAAVEKINSQYKQDTRDFFYTLDPMQRSFTPAQQAQYCGIMTKYAEELYAAADKNRSVLERQYANISRQDVKQQVLNGKEMQQLKNYNVQCDLN